MAYDKHTWISGETITATELNDMESGIENNSERLDELTATVNKNTTDIDSKLDKSSVTTSLTSTSDTDALAASAGKTLNDALGAMSVKYKVVSATTTASGVIGLTDLTPGNSTPIIVYDAAGHTFHIRRGSSTWVAIVKDSSDIDIVANTAVDAYVRYINWTN